MPRLPPHPPSPLSPPHLASPPLPRPPLPPPALSALGASRVLVAADGAFPWRAASLLRAAGVGRVDLGTAAADDLAQRLPPVEVGALPPLPALVVLVSHLVVAPARGEPWLRCGVPVLPVVVEAARVVVGPVVHPVDAMASPPGVRDRAGSGPCLHCLDLVRADLDDGWPTLVARATGPLAPADVRPDVVPDDVPDAALHALAAAALAMVVTGHLGGRPLPVGVSVEASLPWPRLDHRRWPRHPDCSRHRHTGRGAGAGSRSGQIREGAPETPGASRETMTG